jgi:hypothetical protein
MVHSVVISMRGVLSLAFLRKLKLDPKKHQLTESFWTESALFVLEALIADPAIEFFVVLLHMEFIHT